MSLFIGCDMVVQYTGARDAISGAYLNSGTCTYALLDADGNGVAGGSGSLSYVAASDGIYRGVIDGAVTALLTEGETYTVRFTFTGGGYDDVQYLELVAKKRKR